jgi:large subunit ribosomal protein L10
LEVLFVSSNLEMKKQVVADIIEKFKNAESVVVCSFSGLTVEQVTELRKQCRENDVHYCVLKNRLVARALNELGIEGLGHLLEGPNAFVFGDKDVTAAPKIISTFIEKNKLTSLEIKGGVMGSEVLDIATIKNLAATPSREELLATLVGCLQSPVSGLVAVLDQIAEKKEAA